ncbi:MAG TPA: hypothetical protein VJM49_16950 [Acidimicrobiales bacterium]|nr:hypothetical protein [Acidimicrobiales bacterium]
MTIPVAMKGAQYRFDAMFVGPRGICNLVAMAGHHDIAGRRALGGRGT